tara:strand:- start:2150 stop:2584 length:435 start_codon:yes stop_codon:yes gene_type:complete
MDSIEKRSEYREISDKTQGLHNKFIRGMFNYGDGYQVAYCACLHDHNNLKTVWISFITGEWPHTGQTDCAVTCAVYRTEDNDQAFIIKDGEESPFTNDDIFGAYRVTREQVLAVDGAKQWFIDTYLALFETDKMIGSYLESEVA